MPAANAGFDGLYWCGHRFPDICGFDSHQTKCILKDADSKYALRNSLENYQNCVLVFKDASSNYLIVRWSRLEGRQAHNLDFGGSNPP